MTRVSITRQINVRDPSVRPSWRAGIQAWQWKHLKDTLPNTDISTVLPDVPRPTGNPSFRIDAYNGFAVDQATSRIFMAGMGGHADYWGNEAYAIDFRDESPAWSILRQPTPASDYTYDSSYYADGRPSSSHTYFGNQYIAALNRIFRFGSGALAGSGNASDYKVNAFSLATGDWDAAGTWADISADSRSTGALTCCQDPSTGDVYVATKAGGWVKYDGTTGARTALLGPGAFWSTRPSAVDTTRGRVLVAGKLGSPTQCKFYDIATGAWSAEISATGAASDSWGGQSLEYIPAIDRFIKKTFVGGEVILIHPETLVCTVQSVAGDSVTNAPSSGSGIWNRFRYLPNLGGCVYYPIDYQVTTGMYFLATE